MAANDPLDPAPLGSWPRTYLLVCIAAVVTIALLSWLTATFDLGPVR